MQNEHTVKKLKRGKLLPLLKMSNMVSIMQKVSSRTVVIQSYKNSMYFNFLIPQSYSSATSKLLAIIVKIMIYTQKSSIITSDYHKNNFFFRKTE